MNELQKFAWDCFCSSGNIEAFLLYKQEEASSNDREKHNGIGENGRTRSAGDQVWRA